MKVSLIAAMSENRVIGKEGRLPWPHLPNDWDNLFRVTAGCKMIMGRKSYDTPDRVWSEFGNYIITQQADYELDEGFVRVYSLHEALELCKDQSKIFVIGGGGIFKEAIKIADTVHLTVVHAVFEGDAFFPIIPDDFKLTSEKHFQPDEKHALAYSFLVYERAILS